jgi:hypothetical protein
MKGTETVRGTETVTLSFDLMGRPDPLGPLKSQGSFCRALREVGMGSNEACNPYCKCAKKTYCFSYIYHV